MLDSSGRDDTVRLQLCHLLRISSGRAEVSASDSPILLAFALAMASSTASRKSRRVARSGVVADGSVLTPPLSTCVRWQDRLSAGTRTGYRLGLGWHDDEIGGPGDSLIGE